MILRDATCVRPRKSRAVQVAINVNELAKNSLANRHLSRKSSELTMGMRVPLSSPSKLVPCFKKYDTAHRSCNCNAVSSPCKSSSLREGVGCIFPTTGNVETRCHNWRRSKCLPKIRDASESIAQSGNGRSSCVRPPTSPPLAAQAREAICSAGRNIGENSGGMTEQPTHSRYLYG